jgi:transcriptional regulator of acetoin/glycerol metabolism
VTSPNYLNQSDLEIKCLFSELGFITGSDSIVPTLRQALKAAIVSDVTVLIDGETGTGKQVLARSIHQLDRKRSPFPFVTAHCSTINESLAESELFGHHRGQLSFRDLVGPTTLFNPLLHKIEGIPDGAHVAVVGWRRRIGVRIPASNPRFSGPGSLEE